jgi:hypothetical protein
MSTNTVYTLMVHGARRTSIDTFEEYVKYAIFNSLDDLRKCYLEIMSDKILKVYNYTISKEEKNGKRSRITVLDSYL